MSRSREERCKRSREERCQEAEKRDVKEAEKRDVKEAEKRSRLIGEIVIMILILITWYCCFYFKPSQYDFTKDLDELVERPNNRN